MSAQEQNQSVQNGEREPLSGVLPVFHTPYLEDESIDYDTLEGEINWLFGMGVDGVVLAMVSEVLRLGSEEREQLAEAVSRFTGGRGDVVISVGAESTVLAERYARQAEATGATAIMAVPPVSVGLGDSELLRYYERILKAVRIPVIVQDASGYVGRPMSIELQAGLMKEWGDRVLFKPEAAPFGPRLSELRDATGGKARIFEGSGGISLVDSYRRGIYGTMPGSDLIDFILALWSALKAGDDKRVYQLSQPVSALVSLQHGLDGFLAVEKYLLVKRGIFKNTIVRGPVSFTLDEETRAEVDRLFAQCQEALAGE